MARALKLMADKPQDNGEQATAPWFCVYGHEHGDIADARSCDQAWDQSWRGSVCPLHDAGLRMLA